MIQFFSPLLTEVGAYLTKKKKDVHYPRIARARAGIVQMFSLSHSDFRNTYKDILPSCRRLSWWIPRDEAKQLGTR